MKENRKQRFIEILNENQILEAEPMSRHTTFRIGGPAELFLVPKSTEEIAGIFKICCTKALEKLRCRDVRLQPRQEHCYLRSQQQPERNLLQALNLPAEFQEPLAVLS